MGLVIMEYAALRPQWQIERAVQPSISGPSHDTASRALQTLTSFSVWPRGAGAALSPEAVSAAAKAAVAGVSGVRPLRSDACGGTVERTSKARHGPPLPPAPLATADVAAPLVLVAALRSS